MTVESITITLPWPPTVNTYWRHWNGRTLLSERGRDYRTSVMAQILANGKPRAIDGRLRVQMQLCPPDRRKRDIDNLTKAVLDALAHSGIYADDGQIDDLHIVRGPVTPDGECIVIVEAIVG